MVKHLLSSNLISDYSGESFLSNVTNCITEIPQDIKLELNNGTLTLKADSKVYKLDGTSVTTTSDATLSTSYYGFNQPCLIYYSPDSNTLETPSVFICFSGNGYPTVTTYQYMLYFDVTNKKYYWTSDSGSSWTERTSVTYPIAIATVGDSNWKSIDQVFNGFGYIGSTVFALPGVKGLIPNGRNEDGTLKNIEFTTTNVLTQTIPAEWGNPTFFAVDNLGFSAYAQYSEDGFINGFGNQMWYDSNENLLKGTGDNRVHIDVIKRAYCFRINHNSGRITLFTSKTAFHAVDYSDFVAVTDSKANVDLSNLSSTGEAKLKSNIQLVNELPANQEQGVLYCIPEA